MSSAPPSGMQFEIEHGEQRATIVEVGGGIRAYDHGSRAVLDPYPAGSICDGAHGAPLIPWPNRLGDGHYVYDGEEQQLALTEPGRLNAIHGLLRWRPWRASEREPHRVVMGARLHPLPGYPFALDVGVAYELSDGGLAVTTTATNVGERACPYGSGQHPYLSAGGGLIDDCTLQLAAVSRVLVDERKLPIGIEQVAGSRYDFSAPVRIGGLHVDSAFGELARDHAGRAHARLSSPDGASVELWADHAYPFIELYTGDDLAPARRRRALAVEPMSCAPNAFQGGEGLIRLEPGESSTASWGVRLAG